MAKQTINNGTFDNDPSAEKIRTAFDKVNDNFDEVYAFGTVDTTADHLKGFYNATTNTPFLVDGVGQIGDSYVVNVAGSHDFGSGSIVLGVNDELKYNGSIWYKSVDNNSSGVYDQQITVTTVIDIDTTDLGLGKNNIIKNGVTAINLTVDGVGLLPTTVQKGFGTTGAITFLQGAGRNLVLVDGTAVLDGVAGSTAVITSDGINDFLRVANA